MQRRQFLKSTTIGSCLLAAAGLFIALWETPTHGRETDSPATIQPGARQLFLDDALIDQRAGLTRVVNPVSKHPSNPLIVPEKPWEAGILMIQNAVVYHEEVNLFKMWCLVPAFAIGGKERRTSYFTSTDGLKWDRPELGLVNYKGSLKNNILPVHVGNVLYDPHAHDAEPAGRLFKGIGWSPDRGQYAAFSEDGVNWIIPKNFHLTGVSDVFRPCKTAPIQSLRSFDSKAASGKGRQGSRGTDTRRQTNSGPRFLGFIRTGARIGRFSRRILTITRSENFLQWSKPSVILKPDAKDDKLAEARLAAAKGVLAFDHPEDHRCEFYSMGAFRYEGIYLGLMGVFDVSFNRSRIGKPNQDGPRHVELVYSRDLTHWERLPGRVPFIPIGGRPDLWDGGMIGYTAAPMLVGDEIRIYYSGQRLTHGALWKEEVEKYRAGKARPMSSVGLATLRRDGFVSLNAGEQPGTLLTKPFTLPEGRLHLNVDATQGEVSVAVLSVAGEPLAGFDRSTTIRGDHQDIQVQWHGVRLDKLHGKAVRLKITAKNARLFSFWF